LIERVRPESIAIMRPDHTAAVTDKATVRTHATSIPMTPGLAAAH
jgi:hypothetical protein